METKYIIVENILYRVVYHALELSRVSIKIYKEDILIRDIVVDLILSGSVTDSFTFKLNHNVYRTHVSSDNMSSLVILENISRQARYAFITEQEALVMKNHRQLADRRFGGGYQDFTTPLAGRIIQIFVNQNDEVKEGDRLFVIESMKMENIVTAPCCGFVKNLFIKPGDVVKQNQKVILFKTQGEFNGVSYSFPIEETTEAC